MFAKTLVCNEREGERIFEFRKRVHSFEGIEIISKTMNWVKVVIQIVKRYVVLILIIPKQ